MNAPALPPSGEAAYGLGDVSSYRLLWPGEAFVTARSDDARGVYHWYVVHHEVPVCTEIWVHPCDPGPSLDLRCADEDVPAPPEPEPTPDPTAATLQFTVHGAETQWGQGVYVVGAAEALGSWDPSKALALEPTDSPTWSGTLTLGPGNLEPGAVLELKFIKAGDGGVEWEPGENRALTLGATGGSFEGDWGQ